MRMILKISMVLPLFLLVGEGRAASAGWNFGKTVAGEKIIARSEDPDSIYLFTPAIVKGFDGRFVSAVDYGGPGTYKLDGPRSDYGDAASGNQIRVMWSDDRGRTWKKSDARIPMMHEILFKAGNSLYMLGHSGRLLITRSDDNGETWSVPSVLDSVSRWHQSCGAVDIHNGKITLVYEQWISSDHPWPGVGPVLMQARVEDDLTRAENWTFSEVYDPDSDFVRSRASGIPAFPVQFTRQAAAPGILEASVVRIYDPSKPFYDPEGRSVVILMRCNSGFPDIGVMLRGYENQDGTLSVGKLQKGGVDMFYAHIPGGELKFHLAYDEQTKLYWMVHSQVDGKMNDRRRLALSYSPDLICWTFAGIVAVGPCDNGARHYATLMIDGDDIFIVSRSGDSRARNAHDGDIVTLHKVRNFRRLVY